MPQPEATNEAKPVWAQQQTRFPRAYSAMPYNTRFPGRGGHHVSDLSNAQLSDMKKVLRSLSSRVNLADAFVSESPHHDGLDLSTSNQY